VCVCVKVSSARDAKCYFHPFPLPPSPLAATLVRTRTPLVCIHSFECCLNHHHPFGKDKKKRTFLSSGCSRAKVLSLGFSCHWTNRILGFSLRTFTLHNLLIIDRMTRMIKDIFPICHSPNDYYSSLPTHIYI